MQDGPTKREIKLMEQSMRLYDLEERSRGFIFTLLTFGKRNEFHNRLEGIFYTVKTLICIFLRRRKYSYNGAEVTAYDFHQSTFSQEWTTVSVGWGILTNWYYNIFNDGNG